jgi:hypothetical protein
LSGTLSTDLSKRENFGRASIQVVTLWENTRRS